MSERIEKSKKNKALVIGAAGALGAGSLLGYSEIRKETPATPSVQPTIEVQDTYFNSALNKDGGRVFYSDANPRELKVVRGEDGELSAETIPGGNPVKGPAIDEALQKFADEQPDK